MLQLDVHGSLSLFHLWAFGPDLQDLQPIATLPTDGKWKIGCVRCSLGFVCTHFCSTVAPELACDPVCALRGLQLGALQLTFDCAISSWCGALLLLRTGFEHCAWLSMATRRVQVHGLEFLFGTVPLLPGEVSSVR